jgi:hypothetical protein
MFADELAGPASNHIPAVLPAENDVLVSIDTLPNCADKRVVGVVVRLALKLE